MDKVHRVEKHPTCMHLYHVHTLVSCVYTCIVHVIKITI
jgi:hypothetical protein